MAFDMDELNKRRQKRRELKDQSEKKQKKQTLVMIGIVAFLIIAIAGVLVFLLISQRGNTPQSPETTQGLQSRPETLPPTTEPPTTRPPDTVIHLAAGGDLNITDKVVAAGNVSSGYDYSKVFLDVLPALAEADVTVLNFEGNAVGAPYSKDSAPPQLLRTSSIEVPTGILKFCGFSTASPSIVTTVLIRGIPLTTAWYTATQVSALKITHPTSAGSLPCGICTPLITYIS